MIQDIDTIVQLFAAIYLTLSIDVQFIQRFWSQSYLRTIDDIIDNYKFWSNAKAKDDFMSQITQDASGLEDSSRQRGAFMFVFCLVILIYSSFTRQENHTDNVLHIQLALFVVGTLFIVISSWLKSYKWWHLIVSFIILLAILLVPYGETAAKECPWLTSVCTKISVKTAIILALIVPIAWQLFSNWMCSTVYKKYLVEKLNTETDDYILALDAVKTKDKTKLPEKYRGVIVDIHFCTTGDTPITQLKNALNGMLSNVCRRPSISVLLRYIFKKQQSIKVIENTNNDLDFEKPIIVGEIDLNTLNSEAKPRRSVKRRVR